MMNSDETPRGMPYQQGRKPIPSKYQDSRYSPSSNYNYNSNNSFPSSQHPRRRFDRFKRDTTGNNNNDRLMRQNDLIIRLLKEIRDRLPPPAVPASYNGGDAAEAARQNGPTEEMERADALVQEPQASAPEAGNQAITTDSAGETLQTEPQAAPEKEEGTVVP